MGGGGRVVAGGGSYLACVVVSKGKVVEYRVVAKVTFIVKAKAPARKK